MQTKAGWQGRFFEDFEVGDHYRHPLGRTITQTDNTWFTLLTQNTAEMHFNQVVGEASDFGRSLVNSTLTLAVVAGQSVIDTSYQAIANLGWDGIKLKNPVFAGDTIWSESIVLDLRESNSRPHAGIVTVRTRGLKQTGAEVLSYVRTFMVKKRAAATVTSFPEPLEPFASEPAAGATA
ncbi:MaoC family dehydratase [Nocardioides sp. LHD-245]|uniref:MaoC family dehydratase n=1 Tax=Nocardioides sp. LHD-245 TaxID=3051387 RepID=UPI0027E0728F|nr:MaoC family dehydratase [Nocardioides sp. LHD-245]